MMRKLLLKLIVLLIPLISCEKDDINPALEKFCQVKPDGWDCEIIQDHIDSSDVPAKADHPLAVIKYTNTNRNFTKYNGTTVHPSLTLDFYPIKQKQTLIDLIKSQQMYSWCIPIYYGETDDYFILTSPCLINGGSFTPEADSCIGDLHESLKGILIHINQDLLEN